ncbi:polysaccharide biosynthesis C-terminal domain-containing protein [Candidatus Saccharibacteria bacterium]|nr:polysaccharide biosynthesis C-terminal domain-containing protein [Candidatus Saccharibacteria bacterium]
MKKNILKNDYFLSLCSKFFIMFFGFISLIFLNRFLGTTLKGEYSSILNYVTIASAILQFGISMIYPRFKRRNIKNCYEIFISLSLIQALIYTVISIALIMIFDLQIDGIFVCIISTVSVLTTQLRYINLVENMRRNTFVVFAMSVCNCVATVLAFLFLESNLITALLIYILKDCVIVFLYAIRIDYSQLFKKRYAKYYLSILKEGFLPMLSGLLIMLNYKVDIVMLDSYSVAYSAIGIYSLGLSISEYVWVIPDIFKDVVQKRTAKGNPIETVNFSLRCSSTFVIFAFIVLGLLNKNLFIMLFGEEFADSFTLTMILLVGAYSMVYYKIIGQLFISDGKSKQYFIVLLIGVLANVVINCLTIPYYGIYGASIASVVSYNGIGIVFLSLYLKYYTVKLKDVLLIRKTDILKFKLLIKKKEEEIQ